MPGAKKCLINISSVPGASVIIKASVLEEFLNSWGDKKCSKVQSGDNRIVWHSAWIWECGAGCQSCRKQRRGPWEDWKGYSKENADGDDLAGKEWVPMAGCLWRTLSHVREGADQASPHLVILILHNLSFDVSDSVFSTKAARWIRQISLVAKTMGTESDVLGWGLSCVILVKLCNLSEVYFSIL